jgi:hypothetical protein
MHDERVRAHLLIHCGACAVTGVHHSVWWQGVDPVLYREDERRPRSTGEIASPDASMEQRVTGEQIRPDAEAHGSASVAGSVHDLNVEIVPAEHLAVAKFLFAHHIRLIVRHSGQVMNRLKLFVVVRVYRRFATVCGFQRRNPTDVVGMSVREQDAIATQTALLEQRDRLWMLQSSVDHQGIRRVAPAEHVAVLIEHWIDDDRELDEVPQRVGHKRQITWVGR